MSANIKPWVIENMDLFTLDQIADMVSALCYKHYTDYQDKSDYDKGKDIAYRSVIGELSRLIEYKKELTKIKKKREKKEKVITSHEVKRHVCAEDCKGELNLAAFEGIESDPSYSNIDKANEEYVKKIFKKEGIDLE